MPFSQEIILVSDIADYDVFKIKRIKDIYPGNGPIGGIYTALQYSSTEENLIVSCDVPLINNNLIHRLLEEDKGQDVVHLATEEQRMPLIGLYRKRKTAYFKERLLKKELKVKDALKGVSVKTVRVTRQEEKLVTNINTPQQLNELNNATEG